MAIYALGDLHLSFGTDKPMDLFGDVWDNHTEKLSAAFSNLTEEDITVFCGDLSWGMTLEEALSDFLFIERLFPGKKIILKGNHDYWWTTAKKMLAFWSEHGITDFVLLHNTCYREGETALCGTRGWFSEEQASEHNHTVYLRELNRLETSLRAAGEKNKVCFFHYPPFYKGYDCEEILNLMKEYQVKECYFGHLHGSAHALAEEGLHDGIDYHLVSADYLNFKPLKIIVPSG